MREKEIKNVPRFLPWEMGYLVMPLPGRRKLESQGQKLKGLFECRELFSLQ